MGVLVNPIGWRLNSNIYWRTNFFTTDENYQLVLNQQNIQYLILSNILDKINKHFYFKKWLRFTKHTIYLQNKKLIFFISLRIKKYNIWRIISKRRKWFMYRKLKGARTRYRWVRRFRKRKIRRFERGLSLIKLRKNLKAQIKLIRVNLKLFKSKTEKKKMQGILAEKILKKKRTEIRFTNLKKRIFLRLYINSYKKKWGRPERLVNFLRKRKRRIFNLYRKKAIKKWNKNYKKLFYYDKKNRGKLTPFVFRRLYYLKKRALPSPSRVARLLELSRQRQRYLKRGRKKRNRLRRLKLSERRRRILNKRRRQTIKQRKFWNKRRRVGSFSVWSHKVFARQKQKKLITRLQKTKKKKATMKIKRSIFRDLVQALEYMYNNEYSSKLQRTPATEKKVARIRRRKLKKLCYTKPTKANRLIKSVYHRKKIMRNLGLYCALWPDLTKNRQDVLKYFLASVFHQRRKRLSMLYKLSRKYKYVRLPRSWVDTYAVEPVIKNFSKFRKKKKNPRWTRYIARYSGRRRPRDRKLHRFLVIYFKILPFLIEFKRFILKTLIKLFNPGLVKIYLLSITKYRSITAKYILWFVEKFLRRYRRIKKMKKVFYKLVKYLLLLKKKFKLRGFKFLLAGRFFRRNRAIYIWRTYGAVPLATKLSKIDFAVKTMQMKYSKPIVKLWICRA